MTRRDDRYGRRIAMALFISVLAHLMLVTVSEGGTQDLKVERQVVRIR